ncbi:uncharacterized protein PHALS_06432 [Plasmopara halstedii]|uniref:Uncharacterized protein n=1 Tax=Plasmopara halstedii TaxID=4781 RepID=A0A0N7L816_PLAHL|nr:uncharacterized protein PHALS_06432 [Plasmopara halstedii]CEG48619.1 hypothetical protein PHALS_06432 [Plasmopara halstedii]|eukprot:XP_024584988.1 hypothetical protein PHALS_06432 [Plasmopara halstedii]
MPFNESVDLLPLLGHAGAVEADKNDYALRLGRKRNVADAGDWHAREIDTSRHMSPTFVIILSKEKMSFLSVRTPSINLQSGLSTMVSEVKYDLLADPNVFFNLVLNHDGNIDVHGDIPVYISCMLIPFTIHLDVSNLLGKQSSQILDTEISLKSQYAIDFLRYEVNAWRSSVVDNIKTELQRVVTQVLTTIVLSHFYTYTDDQGIFAFTDVSFEYSSRVLLNIPSLLVKVQSADRQTILVVGLKQFFLGNGKTFISAYTEVFKNQSDPLQSMLQAYLAGKDLVLSASGSNANTNCYSLHLLDLVNIKLDVPAKIDGKPAFLRECFIKPTFKEIDSKTRRCLLNLELLVTINNPLPIHFDLYEIELDLLYERWTIRNRTTPKFLAHVNSSKHVSWSSHVQSSIFLKTTVQNFENCMDVVELYLHDQLAFDIKHGRIYMGVGSGNISIQFTMRDIERSRITVTLLVASYIFCYKYTWFWYTEGVKFPDQRVLAWKKFTSDR